MKLSTFQFIIFEMFYKSMIWKIQKDNLNWLIWWLSDECLGKWPFKGEITGLYRLMFFFLQFPCSISITDIFMKDFGNVLQEHDMENSEERVHQL